VQGGNHGHSPDMNVIRSGGRLIAVCGVAGAIGAREPLVYRISRCHEVPPGYRIYLVLLLEPEDHTGPPRGVANVSRLPVLAKWVGTEGTALPGP